MLRSYESLTLAGTKAAHLGVAYNIAIVDPNGHLVVFARQDVALFCSIDLAIDKAVAARIFDEATSDLASLAHPGRPLFRIQESNAGKIVTFGGGISMIFDGSTVGAAGASAETVEQDMAVAEPAIVPRGHPPNRLEHALKPGRLGSTLRGCRRSVPGGTSGAASPL